MVKSDRGFCRHVAISVGLPTSAAWPADEIAESAAIT
jgi:hypothetical protein